MCAAGESRGLPITGTARQVLPEDLAHFDLILAMDRDNLAYLHSLDPDGTHRHKVKLFRSFCSVFGEGDVPDPYYGGPEGFELVLDILADGCRGVIEHARGISPGSLD